MPLSRQEMAENYGFALAFLKSDKSLWNLFKKAVDGNWEPQKFQAELRGISWYKKNGESARNYELLRTTDPASFNRQRSGMRAQIQDAASAMGATMSARTLQQITQNAMKFGWNESQIRNSLAQYVKMKNGVFAGDTGEAMDAVVNTAYKNGIRLDKTTRAKWAQSIAKGNNSADFYMSHIRNMAKSLAPGYADQLQAGMDLQDIMSPYIQAKAEILETNPADIDLFDRDIRSAMSGMGKDGKPATKTLWQFEQDMKKKPEWLKTKNAQDGVMSVARQVLNDFGFRAS